MKSAKDRMDIISAYQQLGSYRAAAAECGTTHRTVKKVVEKFHADQAGVAASPPAQRAHNYDAVADLGIDQDGSGADDRRQREQRDAEPAQQAHQNACPSET